MLRRSVWCLDLMESVWDEEYGVFVNHPWWEQSSMYYLVFNMKSEERERRVKWIEQEIVNPYPNEYSNPIHKHYIQGVSFMLAFSGCNTYVERDVCNGLYTKYAERALLS